MGWHTSSDPRRREGDIRRNEAESYKQVRKISSVCGILKIINYLNVLGRI